jgi:hypothetical protein
LIEMTSVLMHWIFLKFLALGLKFAGFSSKQYHAYLLRGCMKLNSEHQTTHKHL